MKRFYTAIEQLYEKVQLQMPQVEGNPCGTCRSCCHAVNMKSHSVTVLELDALEDRLGAERVRPFRRYIAREKDSQGRLVFEACPFLVEQGCSIHQYRPLACRLYGHYRTEDTELLDHCTFRGKEIVVPAAEQRRRMPGCLELNALGVEYNSYQAPSPTTTADVPSHPGQGGTPESDYDVVIDLMAEGRHEEALGLLESEDSDLTGVSGAMLAQLQAECHQAAQNYRGAAYWYRKALEQAPDNPQLHYHLGTSQLMLGELAPARDALSRSLEISPDDGRAHGMLGVVLQMLGDNSGAEASLTRALTPDSPPGFYHLYLAQAQQALGNLDSARKNFLVAAQVDSLRPQAEQALATLS